ncbi:MAG: phage minor head protein [Chroococcidiopsis sp.]
MVKSPFLKPFPAAIAFFKSKIGLPSENWKTISEEYSAIAFTIATVTKVSILKDVQDAIAQQLESGVSPEQFRATFKDIMTRRGWSPNFSPYRVSLILSQNVRQSMAYGRWEQSEEPGFKQRHPYRIYRHRDSVVPRPHHKAQDGKVFPADADVWKAIAPPPFGCKCSFYNLSQRQLENLGLTVSKPPSLRAIAEPSLKPGFPESLTEQRSQLIERAIASLPPNLAALLEEEVELSESLDFATGKIKSDRTCKKGFPCGNSCISRTKMCSKVLEGQYKTAAEWLESKLPPRIETNTATHTEFIARGYSAMGSERKAEIDALLKGDPEEKERIANEYIAVRKEFMAALDNNRIKKKELENIRARHRAAEDAHYNYDKYNRRAAAQKMEEFRTQLLNEGLPLPEAKNILERLEFDTSSISSINKALNSNFTRADLDEAIMEFQQLTNGKSSNSLKAVENSRFANGRAYANRSGDLSIGSNPDKRVIFHELGHHVEYESDTTLQAAKSWIKSRSTGEAQSLKALAGEKYEDDEIAYPDKFIHPYVGKIYPDATEVVSMGIEYFTTGKKMLELYQADPEHFAFTVGVIKR